MNINGSMHLAIQSDVLIVTLAALGAKVRWRSCIIFALRPSRCRRRQGWCRDGFCVESATPPEYWSCAKQMLTVPGADGCDLLVDDGGDAMLPNPQGQGV